MAFTRGLRQFEPPTLQPWQVKLGKETFQQFLHAQSGFDADLAEILFDAARDAVRAIQRTNATFSGNVRAQQYSNAATTVLRGMWDRIVGISSEAAARASEIAGDGALDFTRHLGKYSENDFPDDLLDYTDRLTQTVASRVRGEIGLSAKVYRTEALANRWVAREINRGVALGESPKELAARVRPMILPSTPGGVSFAAKRLARTEINNAFHLTSKAMYEEMPWVVGVKWNKSRSHLVPDICDRYAEEDHDKLGPGVYKPASVPIKPHPQCWISNPSVSGPPPLAAVSRWWEGDAIEICVGNPVQKLTGTPNHPILTPKGWVELGQLRPGDKVLGYAVRDGMLSTVSDYHQTPSRIENIAAAFLESSEMATMSVPGAAEQFHGDGTEGQVSVIGTYGGLQTSAGSQHLSQSEFFGNSMSESSEAGGSSLTLLSKGYRSPFGITTSTGMSVGLLDATSGSTRLTEVVPHHTYTDTELLRRFSQTQSSRVQTYNIISTRRFGYAGHVYNLQTTEGWYGVQSTTGVDACAIISGNCLCYVVPIAASPEEFATAYLSGDYDELLAEQGIDTFGDQNVPRVMAGQKAALADGQDTQTLHDHVRGRVGKYTAEREVEHQAIMDEFLNKPGVVSGNEMVFMGGLPGAGKSTFINSAEGQRALNIDVDKYITLNPDDVKAAMIERGMLPDYQKRYNLEPREAAALIHEESSDITAKIARRASFEGKNVIWDITMASPKSVEKRVKQALDNVGPKYDITMVYIDTDPDTSAHRAMERYKRGGRFVAVEHIRSISIDDQGRTLNRQTFEQVRTRASSSYLVKDGHIVDTRISPKAEPESIPLPSPAGGDTPVDPATGHLLDQWVDFGGSTKLDEKERAQLSQAVLRYGERVPDGLVRGESVERTPKQLVRDFAPTKKGKVVQFGVSSWSTDLEAALPYAENRFKGPTSVVYHMDQAGRTKGLNVSNRAREVAGTEENEWVTQGSFYSRGATVDSDGVVHVRLSKQEHVASDERTPIGLPSQGVDLTSEERARGRLFKKQVGRERTDIDVREIEQEMQLALGRGRNPRMLGGRYDPFDVENWVTHDTPKNQGIPIRNLYFRHNHVIEYGVAHRIKGILYIQEMSEDEWRYLDVKGMYRGRAEANHRLVTTVPYKLRREIKVLMSAISASPDDPYFETKYKMPGFRAAAQAGNRHITIWNNAPLTQGTLFHESTHLLDQSFGLTHNIPLGGGAFVPSSHRERWDAAVEADKEHSKLFVEKHPRLAIEMVQRDGRSFPILATLDANGVDYADIVRDFDGREVVVHRRGTTIYGATNDVENIAESLRQYMQDKQSLRQGVDQSLAGEQGYLVVIPGPLPNSSGLSLPFNYDSFAEIRAARKASGEVIRYADLFPNQAKLFDSWLWSSKELQPSARIS